MSAKTRLMTTLGLVAALATITAPRLAYAAHSEPPPPGPATLTSLRADVTRTSDRLAAATIAWERGQQQLGLLIQRKISTREAGDQLETDARNAQQRVSALAASLYRNPVDPMLTAVLTGDSHAIDVMFVRRALQQTSNDRQRDAKLLNTRAAQAHGLLAKQEDATQSALRLQRALDDQLTRLEGDPVRQADVRHLG